MATAYLKDVYFNPRHPASFGGVDKLYRAAVRDGRYDITRSEIKKFLEEQETYSLHRKINKRFRRNRVLVTGKDDQWEMDLMDMTFYAKHNDGIHYVLLIIDVFSKFIWLRALKNKTGTEVKNAIEDVFATGRKPRRIRTDKGQEFLAKTVQSYLKADGIEHFSSHNELKANIAERAIKTIKMKIQHYMTSKQTFKYIEHLQDFADSYNESVHRSIDMAPEDVTAKIAAKVWKKLYWQKKRRNVKSKNIMLEIMCVSATCAVLFKGNMTRIGLGKYLKFRGDTGELDLSSTRFRILMEMISKEHFIRMSCRK